MDVCGTKGENSNQYVYYQLCFKFNTILPFAKKKTCAAAMQHKDFQTKDLRSQCNMGDGAYVYYCRCCGELATEEATS